MKLLRNMIAVKKVSMETLTKGGLHIPSTTAEENPRYEVMAVGPGLPEKPMTVKVGDVVWIGNGGVYTIKFDPTTPFFLVEEDQVILIEEPGDIKTQSGIVLAN